VTQHPIRRCPRLLSSVHGLLEVRGYLAQHLGEESRSRSHPDLPHAQPQMTLNASLEWAPSGVLRALLAVAHVITSMERTASDEPCRSEGTVQVKG